MRSKKEYSPQKAAIRIASCNFLADFDLEKYDPSLHIMIEFLKGHPIHQPMTKSIDFPPSIIHTAYTTAVYNSEEDDIEFNINEDKVTKLSKDVFLKAIGVPESKEEKTFYEPTNEEIFDMLDEMGYLPPRLEQTTAFKKAKLPRTWQFLVHIILRCLTGKSGGIDTVNRPFLVLLFGIYTGKEVDIGTFLWKDFVSYLIPKKKEIPCARFWALVLETMYANEKVKLPEEEKPFNYSTIARYNIWDQSDFGKVGRLPEAMLQYIDENSEVLIKYREEMGSPELENPIKSPQPTSPTRKKQIASKAKKSTGLGTKRKSEITPTPQAKKRPTQSIPTSQKAKGVEEKPSSTSSSHSSSQAEEDVSKKHGDTTHTPAPSSQKEDVGVERTPEPRKTRSQVRSDEQKLKEQEPRGRPVEPTLNSSSVSGGSAGEASERTTKSESVKQTREQSEREKNGTEEKERNAQIDLNIDLREEQKNMEEEEEIQGAAKVIDETNSGEAVEGMEQDFIFPNDEGLIQDSDSESSSIMELVKPSKSKVFLESSETESEHIKEVPKEETNTLPTTTMGTSTPRRRTKRKDNSKPRGRTKRKVRISRVEFNSLKRKLSHVLEVVKKIPPSNEKFVSKEDFGELKKIVTSLAQSVPNLETREKTIHETIVNSTVDIFKEMEHKRTDDTFKYLNRMDEMIKMVKEIQQSYHDLTTTTTRQHEKEIARLKEQLRDYRNKNIILQAVLVKVMESAHQLIKPISRNKKLDEVLCAIQKVQNSVNAFPNTVSNNELSKQVQQSFGKVFELIHNLKGQKLAGFSSTKVGEGEDVMINVPKITEILDKGQTPMEVCEKDTNQQEPTPWVYVTRQLRHDEIVPKQTTSPPSSDEYQWDIPMSPNAGFYPVFQPLHPHLSIEIQTPIELKRLDDFFKTHAQPANDVWSLRRIVKVLGYKKMYFQKKEYFGFDVVRSDNKEYFFSEADFPNLNPNDLYVIGRHFQNKLAIHEPSRLPFVQIQSFLRCLLNDLGSIDVEQAVNNPTEEIESKHRGPVEEPELGIVFSKEKDSPRLFFRLKQKHLCTTEFLEEMVEVTLRTRKACKDLKIKIIEELEWLVAVRKWVKRVADLVNVTQL